MHHVCAWCFGRTGNVGFPGTGVSGGSLMWMPGTESGPLEDQNVLSITGPSLQPPLHMCEVKSLAA